MSRNLFALLTILVATEAGAEGLAANLAVDHVRADKSGKGYVAFVAPLGSTPPACVQTDYVRMLAFDLNTAGGRAIMALALAAKTTGSTIYARGTGACATYGVMEDWEWGRAH